MKGLSRLCNRVYTTYRYSKSNSIPICKRYEYKNGKTLQLLRHQSTTGKILEGPDLKDFIAEAAVNNQEPIDIECEPVPYVDQLDIDGKGQKVYFSLYGCQMNVNDLEIVLSILQKNGYQRTLTQSEADVILFMTCAIRESAETKIWEELKKLKFYGKTKKNRHVKIGVLGCMAERLKHKLIENDKTVDLVAGPDSYKDLPRLLALTRNNQKAVNVLLSLDETYADVMPVRLDESKVTAYVSITRGCDNMCTYCIVPFTRGRERSRPVESILEEVRLLSESGVKQVTLLGQNVNSYRYVKGGDDTKEPTKIVPGFKTVYKPKLGGIRFETLLDKVSQVDPNMRIRFTSPHPKDFPDEVLYLIRDRKNICCGIHLPLQSGSNSVLERMRRGYTREAFLELVDHIRSILPNIKITTDIIVGFCGETDQDFEDTLDVIRKVGFNFVFFYPFSMREKTTAYRRYQDDVSAETKAQRLEELRITFRSVSEKLNRTQISETQLVLVDGFSRRSNEYFQGRNDGNLKVIIPRCDIPASISSRESKPIEIGDYVAVQITDASSQVLRGNPLYHTSLVDFEESQTDSNLPRESVSV